MPAWLDIARQHIGQREVPGPGVNAWIRQMWLGLRGGRWFWSHFGEDDSKLPWCGAMTAHCLKEVGLPYPERYASALAWASYGEACGPELGAIAVLTRKGGGHVGFVVAVSPSGQHVCLLGGNQGDAVSEAWFDVSRITAYRCPPGQRNALGVSPTLAAGQMSRSEA